MRSKRSAILSVLAVCVSCGAGAQGPDATLRVHRIEGGPNQVYANAYVIEGRESVVLVDSLLTREGGATVRARIKELGKPLFAVVLTHGHPDHYGGLATALEGLDVPIYAVKGVDDVIRRDDAVKGEALAALGIAWPQRRTFPTHIVADGEVLELGDISLRLQSIGPAESDFDSIWILEKGADDDVFMGDLLTVGEHVYTADGHTRKWIETIERLRNQLSENATLYVGHGKPTTSKHLGWLVDYLERYRSEIARLAEDGVRLTDPEKDELRRAMIEFVGNDRNARWTIEGADPVAQEMASQPNRGP